MSRQSVESEGRCNPLLQRSRGESGLTRILDSPLIFNKFSRMEIPTACNTLSMPQILAMIWRDHKPFVGYVAGMFAALMLAFLVLVVIIAIGNCRVCAAFCNDGGGGGGRKETADWIKGAAERGRCNLTRIVNDTSRETELRLRAYFEGIPLSRCEGASKSTYRVADHDNNSVTTEVTVLGPEGPRAATRTKGDDMYDLFLHDEDVEAAEREQPEMDNGGKNDRKLRVREPTEMEGEDGTVLSAGVPSVRAEGGGQRAQGGDVVDRGGNCACIFAGQECRCLTEVLRLPEGEARLQAGDIELDYLK